MAGTCLLDLNLDLALDLDLDLRRGIAVRGGDGRAVEVEDG